MQHSPQQGSRKKKRPKLYAFQKQGVRFLNKKKGRALIADEMGLGKTAQALTWLRIHPEKRPVVIITPATLKENWLLEIEKWRVPGRVVIIDGREPDPGKIRGADIIIINYEILGKFYKRGYRWYLEKDTWVNTLRAIKPQVAILDEAHRIKDWKSMQTRGVRILTEKFKVPHIFLLTGTPIVNGPIDLFVPLSILNPVGMPNFKEFTERYCDPQVRFWGTDYSGSSNLKELNKWLESTVMIRRLKKDVLSQLPAKIDRVVPVKLSNRKEYDKANYEFLDWVKETYGEKRVKRVERAETLVKVGMLRKLCAEGKIESVVTWIKEHLKDNDGKLVVFTVHRSMAQKLAKEFKGSAVSITGRTKRRYRARRVRRFQNDPSIRLFIGNIRAAGEGITLTAAHAVAFTEIPWTPAAVDQAADRVHRIGQGKPVSVSYLIARHTVESKMLEIIHEKEVVSATVVDGGTVRNPILNKLIKSYLN